MATEAQTAANRRNAESSTGPRTKEGKSRSSRNAVTFGIYSASDFVLPEDNSLYHHFCENFRKEPKPEGPFEQTLAAEIVHAAWRLRRCSANRIRYGRSRMRFPTRPMANPATAPMQEPSTGPAPNRTAISTARPPNSAACKPNASSAWNSCRKTSRPTTSVDSPA